MEDSSDRPEKIGPYTVVDVLGEGGMGIVYLAEQSEPVQRTVALKILKVGLDSDQIVTRFQKEFQALAVMDHPSIAKVFDAGITEDGRPYFVMERVTGSPIRRYCDAHRLTVRQRVRLFADVCRAVQHAHQKGVIHRDLKPSNVLVSEVDGRPHPRIIDFGIAKAVSWATFDDARVTRESQAIGTPAYMSPEQIKGSADIDTRSDIYSLGLILYELLVGSLPFPEEAYRGWVTVAATLRRETPKLRRRFDSNPGDRETVAGLRGTSAPVLRKELGGDLEWIVSRAMERDRSRRYETAVGLALEVERYLAFEPVRARGTGGAYRLGRFVRRHRLGVGFGATVVVGLVGFAVAMSIQADRIARARDDAEFRRDQAWGFIDFMVTDLREKLEPIGRLELLNDVDDQVDAYFGSLPEDHFTDQELLSRSQALYQRGSVRLDEGRSAEAEPLFRESLRLTRALVDRDPENDEWLFGLSQSHYWVGYMAWIRDDLASTEEQWLGYLAAAERLVQLHPENLDYRLELGFAHGNLGTVREERGDLEGAVAAFTRVLEVKEELVRADPSNMGWLLELAETHNKLGVANRRIGAYGLALEHHRREHDLKVELLEHDPTHSDWRQRLAMGLSFLSAVQERMGEMDAAVANQRQTVQMFDSLAAYDPSNAGWRRDAAVAHLNLGELLTRTGRVPEALDHLRRSRRILEDLVQADPTGFGWMEELGAANTELAHALLESGRRDEALLAAQTACSLLAGGGAQGRSGDRRIAEAELVLGYALAAEDRPSEARDAWLRALEIIAELVAGPGGVEFDPLHAEALLALDRLQEAREVLTKLWARGYGHPYLGRIASQKGIKP